MRKPVRAVLVLTVLAVLPGTSASAAVRYVDAGSAECPQATFSAIQAAVDAARAGDTIVVCPGRYDERLVIAKRVRIRASEPLAASIVPSRLPLAPGAEQVQDAGIEIRAPGVVLDGLHVFRSHGLSDCSEDPLQAFIWARKGTGIKILNSLIQGFDENPDSACGPSPFGNAQILVGAPNDRTPLNVTIQGNRSEGAGGFNCACGAIEAHSGYTTIRDNVLVGARGGGFTFGGRGISFRPADPIGARGEIRGNQLSQWDIGAIELTGRQGRTSGFRVFANTITDSRVGLFVLGRGDRIERNTVTGNAEGIRYSGEYALIQRNRVTGNAGNGIEIGTTLATRGVRLLDNVALGNGGFDCFDATTGSDRATGTANRWIRNIGRTDSPEGLCSAP